MKNRVRELREGRGLSQAEFGEKVGVSRQTIYAIEVGKYDPSLPLAFQIANQFGCRIEDIFDPKGVAEIAWKFRYCASSSRPNRNNHNTPITCQYQPAISTITWRTSMRRDDCRPIQRNQKSGDTKHQMKRVSAGHQIEKMAVGIGCHKDAFAKELAPGSKLTRDKQTSQNQRGYEPRKRTLSCRTAEPEPFFHHVQLTEDAAPRHFHRQATQYQDRRIDP